MAGTNGTRPWDMLNEQFDWSKFGQPAAADPTPPPAPAAPGAPPPVAPPTADRKRMYSEEELVGIVKQVTADTVKATLVELATTSQKQDTFEKAEATRLSEAFSKDYPHLAHLGDELNVKYQQIRVINPSWTPEQRYLYASQDLERTAKRFGATEPAKLKGGMNHYMMPQSGNQSMQMPRHADSPYEASDYESSGGREAAVEQNRLQHLRTQAKRMGVAPAV